MTLREQLEQMLVGYGLSDAEALAVVERVVQTAHENNLEIKNHWDKDLRDYVPSGKRKRDYTSGGLQDLQDAVFDGLLNIARYEARNVVYARMEALAELIMKLK